MEKKRPSCVSESLEDHDDGSEGSLCVTYLQDFPCDELLAGFTFYPEEPLVVLFTIRSTVPAGQSELSFRGQERRPGPISLRPVAQKGSISYFSLNHHHMPAGDLVRQGQDSQEQTPQRERGGSPSHVEVTARWLSLLIPRRPQTPLAKNRAPLSCSPGPNGLPLYPMLLFLASSPTPPWFTHRSLLRAWRRLLLDPEGAWGSRASQPPSCNCLHLPLACVLSRCSRVRLFATLWTVARQAALSVGFSRQEYWSGLPCPPPGDHPHPGIKPASLMPPALAGGVFTTSTIWEAPHSPHDTVLKYHVLGVPSHGGVKTSPDSPVTWRCTGISDKGRAALIGHTSESPEQKAMAPHSSVPAWRILGTGEPGGLPSMGSHRVGHDWSYLAAAAAAESPVEFLPPEYQGLLYPRSAELDF